MEDKSHKQIACLVFSRTIVKLEKTLFGQKTIVFVFAQTTQVSHRLTNQFARNIRILQHQLIGVIDQKLINFPTNYSGADDTQGEFWFAVILFGYATINSHIYIYRLEAWQGNASFELAWNMN